MAVIELVSPGNKDTKPALRSFVRKSAALLHARVHLLVVDPFPPGWYDPHGMHPAVWGEIALPEYVPPPGKPLTAAS